MSLIIKISRNGSSQEYLFGKLGPILIGSDSRCDLHLDDPKLEGKVLEVKLSGGNIFVKEVGARSQIFKDSVILPFREDVRYHEGETIALKNTNYQITIQKGSALEAAIEPPPFFENDFRERIEKMNFRIREKEVELKNLDQKEEKKKSQISEIEEKYHRQVSEKGRLDVEVNTLKTQKEVLTHDLRKKTEKQIDTEDKINELKDFVYKLENEEKELKETIIAQNLILANLKDEREKRIKEVEDQRILLANLELDKLKAEDEVKNLKVEFEIQENEIQQEKSKVQKILTSTQEAMKEGAKIQSHIAHVLKEKTFLDHEVKDLQDAVSKLETQRKDHQSKLLDIKTHLEHEENKSRKMREEIARQAEEEANLRLINSELRAELVKVEEKLSTKKSSLNQIEFQSQDYGRKLSTINYELDRSSLRLKELQSQEKAQELKVLSLRDDFHSFNHKLSEDKKSLNKAFDEEKSKLESELHYLKNEIAQEQKNLAQVESQKNLAEVTLDEIHDKQRVLSREKLALEGELVELRNSKSLIESKISDLSNEAQELQHARDRAQRDLSSLKLKLMECETQIKESIEDAKIEVENIKREERAKIQAEKEVCLAEVEAFRQKSMFEVENEYRRKEDEIHQKKQVILKEADEIIKEARKIEVEITEEASKRLREATLSAQERENSSHVRVKEAQEYFKSKEKEADEIVQKARIESRGILKKTELELMEDLAKRKAKIKKFLTHKQEIGLAHQKQVSEQHFARLKREEDKAHARLEELKRKELKKVSRIREEELSREGEMRAASLKEIKSHKEKALKEIAEMRKVQEAELADKKKSVLEHINQTKFKTQQNWEQEIRKEKEQFERTKKDRITNATQAVMNVLIAETGPQGERELLLKEKIKATIEMAINGGKAEAMKEVDQILDFNPMKRKKVLPVLKKFSLRIGVPAGVAIIMLGDIGNVRTSLINGTQNLLKQQQSASEIYVNQQKTEWKEKNTYNPEQSTGYKQTYVDNMVFTKDFEKVMENEEFQNDWILKVHEFITTQLELSEDIAINFISAEGTLIKELAQARSELHPSYLDKGMKKMRDLETTHLGWLNEKIPDPAKKAKFDTFRKDYYNNFYKDKFGADRSMASEKKL